MPRSLTFPLVSALALVLFLGAACAERPTAPAASVASATSQLEANHDGQGRRDDDDRLVACARRPVAADTLTVGRRGGTLRFGGNSLTIPEGALHRPVTITARVVPSRDVLLVEFEPSGLEFDRPATLVLNTAGCVIPRGADPDVVYVGHDGRILERIEATLSRAWQRITAPIEHFSGYSIAL